MGCGCTLRHVPALLSAVTSSCVSPSAWAELLCQRLRPNQVYMDMRGWGEQRPICERNKEVAPRGRESAGRTEELLLLSDPKAAKSRSPDGGLPAPGAFCCPWPTPVPVRVITDTQDNAWPRAELLAHPGCQTEGTITASSAHHLA